MILNRMQQQLHPLRRSWTMHSVPCSYCNLTKELSYDSFSPKTHVAWTGTLRERVWRCGLWRCAHATRTRGDHAGVGAPVPARIRDMPHYLR